MSSITNFISGAPVPAQPTGSDTSTNFPQWYQDFLYNAASAAQGQAGQAYVPPPTTGVAPPSAQSQQAWQMANNNVGDYEPALGGAGALTMSAATPLSAGTINNYAGNAGNEIGGIQGGLNQGVTGGALNSTAAYQNQYTQSLLGQQQQYMGAYTPSVINGGSQITGALNQATQGQIGNYMSPYLGEVAGGLESALNTNLEQNVLPSIQDRYVAAGQVASPQQMQAENNAVYQNQQALGQSLAPALEQGYTTALGAAENAANTGFGYGASGANTTLGLGQTGAGTTLGAGLSSSQGALNAASGAFNTGTGTAQGEQQIQEAAGAQLGQLGALTQQLGQADVNSVGQAGSAQDAFNQAQAQAQLQQYQTQQQYPWTQLSNMVSILAKTPIPSTTQTQSNIYSPYAANAASPLATGIQTTALGSALGIAKGGHIRRLMSQGALTSVAA